MSALTEAQLQEANRIWHEECGSRPQPITDQGRSILMRMAPHLQLPLDQPNNDECHVVLNKLMSARMRSFPPIEEVRYALGWLVDTRNAVTHPKEDPRRAKIVDILKQYPDRAPEIADKILEALDEVSK